MSVGRWKIKITLKWNKFSISTSCPNMKDKPLNSLNAKVAIITVDPGRKLNVHKTFKRRPGRLLNVLCTFNLHPVSTGETDFKKSVAYKKSVYIQLS